MRRSALLKDTLEALVALTLCTLVCLAVGRALTDAEQIMLYLSVVAWVASRAAPRVVVATVLLSVGAFDFFFTTPYYTLHVDDPRLLRIFVVMALVGLIVSSLSWRLRQQLAQARLRELRARSLYELSRRLLAEDTHEGLECALTEGVGMILGEPPALWFDAQPSSRRELKAPDAARLVLWHDARGDVRGGVQISPAASDEALETTLELAGALALLAADRITRMAEHQTLERALDREQIRSTLLSSVSHDLRTPLATLLGAASALRVDLSGVDTPDAERARLMAQTVQDEALYLERLLQNLLEMTRLQGGVILKPQWHVSDELLAGALARLRSTRVQVTLGELVMVPADALLVEQALLNLIENALKYSPPEQPVRISVTSTPARCLFSVADCGPGIPEAERALIFEKFYRGAHHKHTRGSGLGLAICQAVAQAHGGEVCLHEQGAGEAGAVFTLALPRHSEALDALPGVNVEEVEG